MFSSDRDHLEKILDEELAMDYAFKPNSQLGESVEAKANQEPKGFKIYAGGTILLYVIGGCFTVGWLLNKPAVFSTNHLQQPTALMQHSHSS